MSKHTPGEWYTNPRATGHQGHVYSIETGHGIAVTYRIEDAPLVSAAPDLLQACANAEAMSWYQDENETELEYETRVKRGKRELLDAIQKARGEQ